MVTAALIPALDEGPRIGRIISALAQALPDATILVVDGGSRDETAAIARAAGATVVPQAGRGYAGALHTGYRTCQALGVERLVQLDADGQHPPEAAPRLLQALQQGNLVMASREGTCSPAPLTRRGANLLLSTVVSRVTGQRLHDVTSGFWALDAKTIRLFAEGFPQQVADANVRVRACRLGLRIVEVPVPMPARHGGRSMHAGTAGFSNFMRSLHAIARETL